MIYIEYLGKKFIVQSFLVNNFANISEVDGPSFNIDFIHKTVGTHGKETEYWKSIAFDIQYQKLHDIINTAVHGEFKKVKDQYIGSEPSIKELVRPPVIEHLISIGFKELIGQWCPVWGQGDGEYWKGKLVSGNDEVYTDRDTTLYKYALNGIIVSEEHLMSLKPIENVFIESRFHEKDNVGTPLSNEDRHIGHIKLPSGNCDESIAPLPSDLKCSHDKIVVLSFNFTEDLGLRSVGIHQNTTGLEGDLDLLKKIGITLLSGMSLNNEDISTQELFAQLGIKKSM